MIIKKFQGKTEAEATSLAREALGSSAVIMNVKTLKKTGLFAFLKPTIVEVTAAVEEEGDNAPAAPKPPVKEPVISQELLEQTVAAGMQSVDDKPKYPGVIMDDEKETATPVKSESRDIEARLDSLHNLIEEKLINDNKMNDSFSASEIIQEKPSSMVQFFKLLYNTLLDNEVEEKYANDLLDELEKMNKPGISVDYALANIYQKLILQFGQASGVQPAKEGPRVVFFIGPTGVGKTTTIAKVASIYAVNKNKKVALFTTDTYRIAAADQLKTYASILDAPFKIIYTNEELVAAAKEYASYDYILVDTAGHSPKNQELKESTRQFLGALDGMFEKEVYLVVSATTKYRDLVKTADAYKELSDYKLIFTKTDETECLGNLMNLKLYTGAAMSYVTYGQNVPDDIMLFNPQATVKQLLGGKGE